MEGADSRQVRRKGHAQGSGVGAGFAHALRVVYEDPTWQMLYVLGSHPMSTALTDTSCSCRVYAGIAGSTYQLAALLSCWYCCRWDNLHDPVHIVMVGKYTVLSDAYLSVLKALQHACMAAGMKLKLTWVEAQYLEPEAKEEQAEKFEESWKQVRACAGAGRAVWRAACCLGVLSLLTVSSWHGLVGSAVCEIANGSTVNGRGYCACVA